MRQASVPLRRAGRVGADPLAIYIHIPFCRAKCAYCDFSSFAGLEDLCSAYVEAVEREIETASRSDHVDGVGSLTERRVKSIYFGGGTPTVLGTAELARLLETCRRHFRVDTDAEITVEANPESATPAKLRELRTAGFNRLSLGFQSLDDSELGLLGRLHTVAKAVASYDAARRAGFSSINIDLIFGIPGQSLSAWEQTLRAATALKPDHVSCYGLSVEPGTRLAAEIDSGRLEASSEDLQADMFELAMDRLAAAGYRHYEISNFAWPGMECRHNSLYWRNGDYLGFGAAAHSHVTPARWSNAAHPTDYIRRPSPRGRAVELSADEALSETIFLGLRMAEGIDPTAIEERFGVSMAARFGFEIEDLMEKDLLERNGRLRLTRRGILLANEVLCRFV